MMATQVWERTGLDHGLVMVTHVSGILGCRLLVVALQVLVMVTQLSGTLGCRLLLMVT